MRIEKVNTIAVVIDIQERLFPVMDQQVELIKSCKILIEGLQELKIELLATQQYTKGLGDTLPELKELMANFSPIEKTSFSCYDEPAFVEALDDSNAKNVIICGIEAHVCVLQTAVDLKQAGYNPIVVLDCISSRSAANKALAVERFRHEGIMVTGYESLLFELTRGAKAPEFKAISKLVK